MPDIGSTPPGRCTDRWSLDSCSLWPLLTDNSSLDIYSLDISSPDSCSPRHLITRHLLTYWTVAHPTDPHSDICSLTIDHSTFTHSTFAHSTFHHPTDAHSGICSPIHDICSPDFCSPFALSYFEKPLWGEIVTTLLGIGSASTSQCRVS